MAILAPRDKVWTMWLLDEPVFLALWASFFFGLALVSTQFGLRHMRPGEGVLISIPLVTLICWSIAAVWLAHGPRTAR